MGLRFYGWHKTSFGGNFRNVKYFILDENHVPMAVDMITWGRWFDNCDRRVAHTELREGVYVSTVFLGLDHNFSGRGAPLLFESMTFTDYGGDIMERYATWAEAQLGHNHMVDAIRTRLATTD